MSSGRIPVTAAQLSPDSPHNGFSYIAVSMRKWRQALAGKVYMVPRPSNSI